MSFFLFIDHTTNVRLHIFVRRAGAEQPAQVVIFFAEQAGTQLTIRCEADPRAMAAERLGDWSDEANFSGPAIREAILARGLAALVGDLLERPARVNALVDFFRGDHVTARP